MANSAKFGQVWLLLWKNLILRKRHWLVSGLEILLPTIFAILLAYMKTKVGEFSSGSEETSNPPTYFASYTENELKDYFVRDTANYWDKQFPVVGYTPNNFETLEFISIVNASYFKLFQNQYCYTEFINSCNPIKWIGFETEDALEAYANEYFGAQYLGNIPDEVFVMGLVLPQNLDRNVENVKLSYKIRTDNVPDTSEAVPWFPSEGPGYDYGNYVWGGFLGMQLLIERGFLDYFSAIESTKFENILNASISLQAYPYPAYTSGDFDFDTLYFTFLPQFLILGFIFVVPSIIRNIVSEKETGINELMNLMGLPRWMHYFGYMLNSLLVLIISITIVVAVFFIPFNSKAGALISHGDPTLWWFTFLLYSISTIAFLFFVSAFFHRTTIAITVGVVLYVITYFAVAFPLEPKYSSLGLTEKMSIALLPNMALHYSLLVMTGLEGKEIGAKWSNLGQPVSSTDNLCLYHMLIMFVINSLLYFVLALYFERIVPSPYGIRKPWYFIFQPSNWGFMIRQKVLEENICQPNIEDSAFESNPKTLKPGIEISNITKVFGTNVAVNNVSLKMYEGQITALLGQNGAGKTTIISMITGMFSPTSGTALVNGYDITTEMGKVRENIGFCPQHNMLFNRLTVLEHFIFFGRVRGLSATQALGQAKELLSRLKFEDKKNTLSMDLSGGQKRKLSLGCALITGTKIVILDEPTSGMDVENRRALWDMLLEFRENRTIVLTSHFMEEVEVLGDRIAIIDHGVLQCSGTSMFLKRYFGTGYILSLILKEEFQKFQLDQIKAFIHSLNSDAVINQDDYNNSGNELKVLVPTANKSDELSSLLEELTIRKEELGIKSFGLTQTTMDDVFIRVGELSQLKKQANGTGIAIPINNNYDGSNMSSNSPKIVKHSGIRLVIQQFYALIRKKMLYSMRKRKLIFSQFILPICLLIVAVLISNLVTFNMSDPSPPMKIGLDSYNNPVTYYNSYDQELGNSYKKSVLNSAEEIPFEKDLSNHLLSVANNDLTFFRDKLIIAASMNETNFHCMHSTIATHSPPLSVNTMINTILNLVLPTKNIKIELTNHPIDFQLFDYVYGSDDDIPPIIFSVLVPIGMALLAASFVILPIEERICSSKQLQIMTGVSHLVYWGSAFVWDLFLFTICISIMTVCIPIFDQHAFLSANSAWGVFFLILFVYGFSSIILAYIISLFTKTVPGGFSLLTIVHIMTGAALNICVMALREVDTPKTRNLANIFTWIGRLFPSFGLSSNMMTYTKVALDNSKCSAFPEEFSSIICSNSTYWMTSDLKSCCANCAELDVPCFKETPYLTWDYSKRDKYCTSLFCETFISPGILQELVYLIILAIIYKIILIIFERGLLRTMLRMFKKVEGHNFKVNSVDEDVDTERRRVEKIMTSTQKDDALIINNLSKRYGTFSAVSKVSFGVRFGEVFGLLGVNGAGKTTTFKMLTGDELITDGNVLVLGENLSSSFKNIGYCPQFDGIIGVLTGSDMLELFGALRGIPLAENKKEVQKWLIKFGLEGSKVVQCQKYSGGMKRRLSAAIAMIGDPQLILLDEPTTGVDPVARREFWDIIQSLKNAGQAIILTSHSMEECETLCSRLGIMVNGEFQCFGGVQHLKTKFAQGYSLKLKLTTMDQSDQLVKQLQQAISQAFQPCLLKDYHQNIIQYHLQNPALDWATLFKTMSSIKGQFQTILEDYSINETTLEEVFLSFARQQYPDRTRQVSIIQKLLRVFRRS